MALMTQVGLEFIARNRAASQMTRFNRGITNMRRNLVRLVALAGGLYAVRRAFVSVTNAYMIQEKAELDLAAALRNTDGQYKDNLRDLKAYAAALQQQTIYGDEAILSQMAYARNLGVTTGQLKDATKAAIGLAAKYRIDLASAMMLIGRASQGQTQMLTRYGIILDDTLSSQEKFEAILRMGADAFFLAEEATKSHAGRLEQLKNRWGDIKEEIAADGGVIDAYTDLLNVMEDNKGTIKSFYQDQIQGLAEITSGFEGLRTVISETFDPHSVFRGGGAGPEKSARENARIARERAFDRLSDAEKAGRMGQLFGIPYTPPPVAPPGPAAVPAPVGPAVIDTKAIIDKARDVQQFIRHQDYMTRQERIQYLKDYQAANAGTLDQVAEANRILHDEIAALERTRLDAMRVYYAEMRERAQDAYLVAMEYAAAYARQVQDDFVRLWDPFIDGTKSAKETMNDFFRQLFLNLAKAQAQMAMMRLWDAVIGPAFGGVSQSVFGGVGSLLGAGARSAPALANSAVPVGAAGVTNNITIQAMDSQDVQRALYKERHFLGGLQVMGNRANSPARRDPGP